MTRSILLFGLTLVLASGAQGALIHYWDFEDAQAGTTTALVDSGTQPASLTPNGAIQTFTGHDGETSVLVPNYGKYSSTISSFGGSFTLEMWWQRTSAGSNGWNRVSNGWTSSPCSLHLGNSLFNVLIDTNASVSNGAWANPAIGGWAYIAVVADASTSTVKAYAMRVGVDSSPTLVCQGAYNGNSAGGATTFNLGDGSKYSGGNGFDWVAVWDSAKSVEEITADMAGVPEPVSLSLLTIGGLGLLLKRRR